MRMLTLIMVVIIWLSAYLMVTAAIPEANEAQKTKLNGILARLDVNDPKTLTVVEDALAAEGETAVPTMQVLLAERQKTLAEAESDNARLGETLRIRQEMDALDSAVIRLTWTLHPREIIDRWMDNIKDANGNPFTWRVRPMRITADQVAQAFPNQLFYSLRFPSYPVARLLPAPLKYNNLFVISKDGVLQQITDVAGLEGFFHANLPAMKQEADRCTAVVAWLHIDKEMAQDGMYRFTIPQDALECHLLKTNPPTFSCAGKAVVTPVGGNQGEITVSMSFDEDGKLTAVKEARNLKAGMRPICQATKLLDPDPIVRRMAEQDLLIMGREAEGYLLEQRTKAAPELQAAIDRIWDRILAR